jgi:hypothetical protein
MGTDYGSKVQHAGSPFQVSYQPKIKVEMDYFKNN